MICGSPRSKRQNIINNLPSSQTYIIGMFYPMHESQRVDHDTGDDNDDDSDDECRHNKKVW